jgi:uncharacterized membrane protein YfcA
MEIIIISIAAFATALLTFFSGFGLGTILMPVFTLFFPVEAAIALTGIVHFSNNLFKISLIGGKADREVLIKFGIPAVVAAFAGAWILLVITKMPSLLEYQISSRNFEVTPVKLIIALLLIIFALLEILPSVQNIRFSRNKLVLGGALSGFFGGLTGIQGAIRSAFLLKSGLNKEAYIATGVVIACLVDFTRISVYASRFKESNLQEHIVPVVAATLAAITGAFLGNKLLRKVTLRSIQLLVAVMLLLISIALGAGLV